MNLRSILILVIGLIVAALLAHLGCAIAADIDDAPSWTCTAIWVIAILAWLAWAFGDGLRGRRT